MAFLAKIALSPLHSQITLNTAQLEELLSTNKAVLLVDLRTPAEIQRTGKIAGAWEIDYYAPDFKEKISRLDHKRPVVLYCASGGRSSSAAAQLPQLGFTKVYNYAGGMREWKALKKNTVSAGEKPRL